MSAFHDNALIGASGQQGYKISRSVRLRSSASAYFNRTAGVSPTSNQKGTFSFWLKRGAISSGSEQWLFAAGSNSLGCYFSTGDLITFEYFGGLYIRPAMVFRDPSAWYHIVVAIDSTQATSSNRTKIYVNGVQVTAFNTYEQYPTQNATFNWMSSGQACYIGQIYSTGRNLDGYLTEFNYIDGQQLTPSSFGETDAVTGVWKPKKYTGTYGTNGFYLNFSDNSSNTATTIGKDYSGNGNNWTPNNISVTAGVTYDSMVDSPTMGATSSNYPVLNPLYKGYGGYTATPVTISNANLTATGNASANNIAATIALPTTGQFYYEYVWTANSGGEMDGGIIGETGTAYFYRYDGTYWNGSSYVSYGASYTTNDVIGVAVDMTNLTFTFYKNGVSQGTKTSAFPSGVNYFPWFYLSNTVAASVNFGQRPFSYTPPTGFVALNTQNLPTPTISNGANYMAATTYTGTGANGNVVTNTVNGVSFQPDFVWGKIRSSASSHNLSDSVRGITKYLYSDLTSAEGTYTDKITSLNSNGFTLGIDNTGTGSMNTTNGGSYVAWQWKAGGASSSNTAGSITSTVSAGATQGFSVVTFTGNYNGSTGTGTVGHGLGVAPKMIIIKNRSQAFDWGVGHASIGWTQAGNLNLTNAFGSSAYFNNTAPTSSVFSVGLSNISNQNGSSIVAYCFAEVAGYSKAFSYTGNGSSDGPFVFLGLRARWIMIKRTDASADWIIFDTSRNTYNLTNLELNANLSGAEFDTAAFRPVDILSNGFKLRGSNGGGNASGGTYIGFAVAENPFKISLAR